MNRILLIEDSPTVRRLLISTLQRELDFTVDAAATLDEAMRVLSHPSAHYLAALVDLTLPDAMHGEAVPAVMAHDVPVIVLTASVSETKREQLIAQGVVDYIIKDSKGSLQYAVALLKQLYRHRSTSLLVVDDSVTSRNQTSALLQRWQFSVYEATDGYQAIHILAKHPDIRLVLTDFHMPGMTGLDLLKQLRERFDRQSLAVIGISAQNNRTLPALFIKHGANDFLHKPFAPEELLWRVSLTLEHLELFQEIRELAHRDPLTRLYNRRFLFEQGNRQYLANRLQRQHAVMVLDIDHFKRINDTWGHQIGDQMLCHFAALLRLAFPDDLIARLGGEEFCVLLWHCSPLQAIAKAQQFLAQLKTKPLTHSVAGDLFITTSAGVETMLHNSLDEALQAADRLLYQAKADGRDCVRYTQDMAPG